MTAININGNSYGVGEGDYDLAASNGAGFAARDASGTRLFPNKLLGDVLSEFNARMPIAALSTTSLAIGTGSKAFTLAASTSLRPGTYFAFSAATGGADGMYCTLASEHTGTALTLNSVSVVGSGTKADWVIAPVYQLKRFFRVAMTGATTIAIADIGKVYDATSGTFTATLPTATNAGAGWCVTIMNSGTGLVTLSESVNGATIILSQYQAVTIISNGSAYRMLDMGGYGEEAWTAPTLLNSWVTSNSITPNYMKTRSGIVFVRGRVSGGSAATVIFTLPAGYRPPLLMQFTGYSAFTGAISTLPLIRVATNGDVSATALPTGFAELEISLSFSTRA